MITLHESHFFLIIILTILITYIIFSILQNCDINCKVNFYKYENYHDNGTNTIDSSIKKPIIQLDNVNNIFNDNKKNNNINSLIGDKTSSHSTSIQGNDIEYTDADEYINKLLNPSYL